MSQYGGGRMGGVALVANGTVAQNFLNCPKGPIERFYLTISVSLKSTGAAFAAVVSTGASAAAEGVDDLDLLLNALFALITYYVDPGSPVGSLTPAQWRTILGLLNQRDFSGTFLNAVSVPISSGAATAFKVIIPIPVSLVAYFDDGGVFRNGSSRLKNGELDYTVGTSLTPTVVMANGSGVCSALAVSVTAETGGGSENDVGMTWSVKRLASLPTSFDLGDGFRIAVLDAATTPANACSSYMFGNTDLWAPSDFGAKYQTERLVAGGFDITARCTPLRWIEPWKKFLDFQAEIGRATKIDAVSGVSTLTIYDVKANGIPPGIVEQIATQVGGGGAVASSHPTPASLPPGTAIPGALASFLPTRIDPSAMAGPNATMVAASPAQLSAKVVQNGLATKRAAGLFGAFGRK